MLKISLGIFGNCISRVVLINYLSHRLLLKIKQAFLSLEGIGLCVPSLVQLCLGTT